MKSDKSYIKPSINKSEEIRWLGNPAYASQIGSIVMGIMTIPFLIGILILVSTYVRINYTMYAVTDKALYRKKGLFSDNIKRVPLNKIQNTEYSRSWSEKKFGFGTVDISTAGSSGTELSFSAVKDPESVQQLINNIKETRESKSKTEEDISNDDIATEIRKTRNNMEDIIEYLNKNE